MSEFENDFNSLRSLSKLNELLSLIIKEGGFQTVFETRLLIAYLIKEMIVNGEVKDTTSAELSKLLEIPERLVRETIQNLSNKEFIHKYKKVREKVSTKKNTPRSFCTDKSIYSLVIEPKLVKCIEKVGYELEISLDDIEEVHNIYKEEMKKLETSEDASVVTSDIPLKVLKRQLDGATDEKEQVLLLHTFMRQGNHITNEEIKEYGLFKYINMYSRLCKNSFEFQNKKASTMPDRIPELPIFK